MKGTPRLPSLPMSLFPFSALVVVYSCVILLPPVESAGNIVSFYDEETMKKINDTDLRHFFETGFAQADHEKACAEESGHFKHQITPIYYRAGENVELPCKMCELGFVFNGRPKQWRHIQLHNVLEFVKDPREYIRIHLLEKKDQKKVQTLKRALTVEGGGFHRRDHLVGKEFAWPDPSDFQGKLDKLRRTHPPDPQELSRIHSFIQSDGKLFIRGAMLESSGIYYCSDDKSKLAHTKLFYLLIAMAPLVHNGWAMRQDDKDPKASAWNVDKWKSSPYEGEECYYLHTDAYSVPMPDEYAHMRYPPADFNARGPGAAKLPVSLAAIMSETDPLNDVKFNLNINYEYSEWTTCADGQKKRFREVHCVLEPEKDLKFVPTEENIGKAGAHHVWASKIGPLFKYIPTLRLHSYFLTSLLYKGDDLDFEHPREDQSIKCDARANRMWLEFTQIILPALAGERNWANVGTAFTNRWIDGSLTPEQLEKFNSCFEVRFNVTENKHYWYSFRGISFIEQGMCP